MNDQPTAVFAYGTLKRGQERESCWPRRPVRVDAATVRARLFDLGPYPALLPADGADADDVSGELWTFAAEDFPATLRALDEVECYGIDDVDLYERRVIDCRLPTGDLVAAYVYFLADVDEALRSPRVRPGADGTVEWLASGPSANPS